MPPKWDVVVSALMNEPWCYSKDEVYAMSVNQIALLWCREGDKAEPVVTQMDQEAFIRQWHERQRNKG